MILTEQDISRRVLRLLNLELVRDQEHVARVISSAPAAEHHASALPPADLHTSVPAAGVSFFPAVVSNHPLSERVHRPAACAVGTAGDPLP